MARSLFGASRTLVVDIENSMHPNLKGFRRGRHLAILLDEMKEPAFLTNNKKVLQSHVDGAWLGDSPTQQYVYEVFLWKIPIIITTNNWSLEKLPPQDREWVIANSVAIYVGEPVWQESVAAQAAPTTHARCEVALKRLASALTPVTSPDRKHAGRCCERCGQLLAS